MSCTIPSIESKLRNVNPELADKLNAVALDTWQQVKESELFEFKDNAFNFNKVGTKKRVKQNDFVEKINKDLGVSIVSELDNKVNVDALVLDDNKYASTDEENSFINLDKYLSLGFNVKESILNYIQDNLLQDRPTYKITKENVDEKGIYYIINPSSDKVTRSKNEIEAASEIAKELSKIIEKKFPGVNVLINPESKLGKKNTWPVKIKIVPSTDIIKRYTHNLRKKEDINLREKYFKDSDVTTDKELLTKIAENDHSLNTLAKHLLQFSKGIKINLLPQPYIKYKDKNGVEKNATGLYVTYGLNAKEFIQIPEFGRFINGYSEPILLHEIIHAYTVNWLDNVSKSDPLYKEINRLYEEAASKIDPTKTLYQLTNIKEFVTGVFTNGSFAKELSKYNSSKPSSYKNLFEEVFTKLLNVLNIFSTKDKSLFEDAFGVITNIMSVQKDLEDYLVYDPDQDISDYDFNIDEDLFNPDLNASEDEDNNNVNFSFKVVDVITKNLAKIQSWQKNKSISETDLWNKIQQLGIPKEQLNLLRESGGSSIEEKLVDFSSNYSYTIEINTAKESNLTKGVGMNQVLNQEDDDGIYTDSNIPEVISEEEFDDKLKEYRNRGFELEDYYDVIFFTLDNVYYEKDITTFLATKKLVGDVTYYDNPTQHYSNRTVPGGTNYTENEIATPAITPSIKGHAQFASDNGIGWFRSDDLAVESGIENRGYWNPNTEEVEYDDEMWAKGSTKTRRILEVQSDLFQKGRDKEDLYKKSFQGKLTSEEKEDHSDLLNRFGNLSIEELNRFHELNKRALEIDTKENQFLQLLNKDNNWVTFFLKAIIQDSAKKGYERVLLPSGNTASKIEGHTTLEEFKKQKEDRIKELENKLSNIKKEGFAGSLNSVEQWDGFGYYTQYLDLNDDGSFYQISKEEYNKRLEQYSNKELESVNNEINQLKQELERIEGPEGFGALKPIYKFYEVDVKNTLDNILGGNKNDRKKGIYKFNQITDEYGNTWNEVVINGERDLKNIFLQNVDTSFKGASPYSQNSPEKSWQEYQDLKTKENKSILDRVKLAYYNSLFLGFTSLDKFKKVISGTKNSDFDTHRQERLKKTLKQFAETFNIQVKDIEDFKRKHYLKTGEVLNANGIADLMEKTIYVANGNLDAMTEEVAHFITNMLPKDSPQYLKLKEYAKNSLEYRVYADAYMLLYDNNEDKVLEEIMGKVLKNIIQNKSEKTPLSLKELINSILDYLKDLIGLDNDLLQNLEDIKNMFYSDGLVNILSDSNINYDSLYQLSFENITKNDAAANKILEEGFSSIISDLKSDFKSQKKLAQDTRNSELFNISANVLEKLNGLSQEEILFEGLAAIQEGFINLNSAINNLKDATKSNIFDTEGNRITQIDDIVMKASIEELDKVGLEEKRVRLKNLYFTVTALQTMKDLSDTLYESLDKLQNLDKPEYRELRDILEKIKKDESTIKDEGTDYDKARRESLLNFLTLIDTFGTDKINETRDSINRVYDQEMNKLLETLNRASISKEANQFLDENNVDKTIYEEGEYFLLTNMKGLSLQTDPYLRALDNIKYASEKLYEAESLSEQAAWNDLVQEYLDAGGDPNANQTFFFAKTEDGKKLDNKLLTKYNYNVYNRRIAQLIYNNFNDNAASLANKNNVMLVLNHPTYKGKSSKEFEKIINILYKEGKIDINAANKLKHQFSNMEKAIKIFNTNFVSENDNISNVLNGLKNNLAKAYKSAALKGYRQSSELKILLEEGGNFDVAINFLKDELIAKKRKYLEDRYLTIKEDGVIRDMQIEYINTMLSVYEEKISDSQTVLDLTRIGEDFAMNITEDSPKESEFKDKDYEKLERTAKFGSTDEQRLAKAKLAMIDHIKNYMQDNQLPANLIPQVAKDSQEYNFINYNVKVFGRNINIINTLKNLLTLAGTSAVIGSATGMDLGQLVGLPGLSYADSLLFYLGRVGVDQLAQLLDTIVTNFDNKAKFDSTYKAIIKFFKNKGFEFSNITERVFEESGDDDSSAASKLKALWNFIINLPKNIFWNAPIKTIKGAYNFLTNNTEPVTKSNNVVPRYFVNKLEMHNLSKDVIGNFSAFIKSNADYNNKLHSVQAAKALSEKTKGIKQSRTQTTIRENIEHFTDAYYYGKYNMGPWAKALGVLKKYTSFMRLAGNNNSSITNVLTAGAIITMQNPMRAVMAMWKPITYALKRMLGKDSDIQALEQNAFKVIKNALRIYTTASGSKSNYSFKETQLAGLLKFNTNNPTQETGEDLISHMLVSMMLGKKLIVDENNKAVDIKKYLISDISETSQNLITLDFEKMKQDGINVDNLRLNITLKNDLNNVTDLESVNFKNVTTTGRETASQERISEFLTSEMVNAISYYHNILNGIYNLRNKPRWATSNLFGALFFYFKDYIIPISMITIGSKRMNKTYTGWEEGILTSVYKLISNVFGTNDYDEISKVMSKSKYKLYFDTLADEYLMLDRFFNNKSIQKGIHKELDDFASEQFALSDDDRIKAFIGMTKDEIKLEVYKSYFNKRELLKMRYDNAGKLMSAIMLYTMLSALAGALPDKKENEVIYFAKVTLASLSRNFVQNIAPFSDIEVYGIGNSEVTSYGKQTGSALNFDMTKLSAMGNRIGDLGYLATYWAYVRFSDDKYFVDLREGLDKAGLDYPMGPSKYNFSKKKIKNEYKFVFQTKGKLKKEPIETDVNFYKNLLEIKSLYSILEYNEFLKEEKPSKKKSSDKKKESKKSNVNYLLKKREDSYFKKYGQNIETTFRDEDENN